MGSGSSSQADQTPAQQQPGGTAKDQASSSSTSSPPKSTTTTTGVLSATEFRPLALESVKTVSHNVKTFRFKFPDANAQLDRSIACFYFVRAIVDGEELIRPYTPVSPVDAKGYLTLLVKIYPAPFGKMGNHLSSMSVGDTLEFKGPLAKLDYAPNKYKHIVMLAGGSGITPMYQVIQAVYNNSEDMTRITLLFSNRSEQDVLLRDDLIKLQNSRPGQLRVVFFVSQPQGEKALDGGEVGRIDRERLDKFECSPDDGSTLALVCGPPAFTVSMAGPKLVEPGKRPQQGELLGLLRDLGFAAENVYKF